MKKKILLFTFIGLLSITTIVSAASFWGTYKGNDIIRVTVNGGQIKVGDVPAISYNNRTMIPIYLLKEAGITYSWDAANKTVDISKNEPVYIQDNKQDYSKTYASEMDFYKNLETLGRSLQNSQLIIYSQTTMDLIKKGSANFSVVDKSIDTLEKVFEQAQNNKPSHIDASDIYSNINSVFKELRNTIQYAKDNRSGSQDFKDSMNTVTNLSTAVVQASNARYQKSLDSIINK